MKPKDGGRQKSLIVYDKGGRARIAFSSYGVAIAVMVYFGIFGADHAPPQGVAIATLATLAAIIAALPPEVGHNTVPLPETVDQRSKRIDRNKRLEWQINLAPRLMIFFAGALYSIECWATVVEHRAAAETVSKQIGNALYGNTAMNQMKESQSDFLLSMSARRQIDDLPANSRVREWIQLEADLVELRAQKTASEPIADPDDVAAKSFQNKWLLAQQQDANHFFRGRIFAVEREAVDDGLQIGQFDAQSLNDPDPTQAMYGITDLVREAVVRDPKLSRIAAFELNPYPLPTSSASSAPQRSRH